MSRPLVSPAPGRRGRIVVLALAGLATFQTGVSAAGDLEPGHVLIRASVDPDRVLVGQRAELKVEVLTRTWFLAAPVFPDTLDVPDAVVLSPETFGVNFSERVGGETYAGQTRTFSVFPLAPGELTIPPVSVTLVVARDDASRSDPVTPVTEPLRIVAAVPPSARGLGLVPATPRLTADQTWTSTETARTVGDAVTRTVTQRIDASVAMVLPAMTDTAPDGVGVYPERPIFADENDRGVTSGRRTDKVTYVFEREGRFDLPEMVVHWWDLDAGELRTERLPGLSVEVAAATDLAADHLQAALDETPERVTAGRALRRPPIKVTLVVLAALVVSWMLRRRLAAAFRRAGRWLYRKPPRETRAWGALQRAIAGEEAAAVLAALYRWLDETGGPAGGPWRDVARRADVATVTALETVERAALGRDGTWSRDATRDAVRAIRRRLAAGKRPRRDRLVRLNPSPSRESRLEAQ